MCIYVYMYVYIYIYMHVYIYVSVNKHVSFCVSLCPAKHQQKLLSSPRLGALKAYLPEALLIRRSVFSTDTGKNL